MTPERTEKITRVANSRRFDLTVVLENVHDPHNIAAVLRTCDAVGIYEIFTIDSKIKWSNRLGKKSSSSANKWVKVNAFKSIEECIPVVKAKYQNMYCTHLNSEAHSIYELDFTKKMALVFGNEHDGVSEELRALCDGNFIIPQIGMISSLNISVACAVTLYEAFRQKNTIDYQHLFQAEKAELLEHWKQIASE